MKVIFSGGGTLGPVTPLLAIHEIIKKAHPGAEFVWVGTKTGPEKELVKQEGIKFMTLSSGKFRRYISFWNVIDIARIIIGFFQSLSLLKKEKASLCISAGGFISVPLHWAAWVLRIPAWIHQQDVRAGLSNKLMAPFAKVITTALEKSIDGFPRKKTKWLGNPVRSEILEGSREAAIKLFNLKPHLPVVFVSGGGTGAMKVNQMIVEAVQKLQAVCQIIHLSGRERPQELVKKPDELFEHYQVYQFFTKEMKHAYAAADIIISRGGFGTITEIAALGKPSILIPKPGHQQENVKFLQKAGAVLMLDERTTSGLQLAETISDLLRDKIKQKQLRRQLQKVMPIAKENDILQIVESLIK